jgi:hypothetical protein
LQLNRSLDQQILDVAIAKRKTLIELNGVWNDCRGELVAGKRNDHAPSGHAPLYPPN